MNKMGPLTGIAGFCLTHESWFGREWMHQPFLNNGKIQATNGHVLIHLDSSDVAVTDGLVPQRHLEKISRWLADNFSDSRKHDWRSLPDLPDFNPCDECAGSGKLEYGEVCGNCDGYGERFLRIPFGNTGFCIRYLRLLSSFDGMLMAPDGENPCPFKFNGGIGLIMPMRDNK